MSAHEQRDRQVAAGFAAARAAAAELTMRGLDVGGTGVALVAVARDEDGTRYVVSVEPEAAGTDREALADALDELAASFRRHL